MLFYVIRKLNPRIEYIYERCLSWCKKPHRTLLCISQSNSVNDSLPSLLNDPCSICFKSFIVLVISLESNRYLRVFCAKVEPANELGVLLSLHTVCARIGHTQQMGWTWTDTLRSKTCCLMILLASFPIYLLFSIVINFSSCICLQFWLGIFNSYALQENMGLPWTIHLRCFMFVFAGPD